MEIVVKIYGAPVPSMIDLRNGKDQAYLRAC